MYKGIFIAASAAKIAEFKHDNGANNLVNIDSNGFKQEVVSFAEYLNDNLEFADGSYPIVARKVTDFSQGSIKPSSNPLSVAIEGDGFFELVNEDGVCYTRDGSFYVDTDGYLKNGESYALSEHGKLIYVGDRSVSFNDRGELFFEDDLSALNLTFIDKIRISDFDDKSKLEKIGDNLYKSDEDPKEAEFIKLVPFHLEGSNLNIAKEMLDLISNSRYFETVMKMISEHDSMTGTLISKVGR